MATLSEMSFEEKLYRLLDNEDKSNDVECKLMLENAPSSFDINWKNKKQ